MDCDTDLSGYICYENRSSVTSLTSRSVKEKNKNSTSYVLLQYFLHFFRKKIQENIAILSNLPYEYSNLFLNLSLCATNDVGWLHQHSSVNELQVSLSEAQSFILQELRLSTHLNA